MWHGVMLSLHGTQASGQQPDMLWCLRAPACLLGIGITQHRSVSLRCDRHCSMWQEPALSHAGACIAVRPVCVHMCGMLQVKKDRFMSHERMLHGLHVACMRYGYACMRACEQRLGSTWCCSYVCACACLCKRSHFVLMPS